MSITDIDTCILGSRVHSMPPKAKSKAKAKAKAQVLPPSSIDAASLQSAHGVMLSQPPYAQCPSPFYCTKLYTTGHQVFRCPWELSNTGGRCIELVYNHKYPMHKISMTSIETVCWLWSWDKYGSLKVRNVARYYCDIHQFQMAYLSTQSGLHRYSNTFCVLF